MLSCHLVHAFIVVAGISQHKHLSNCLDSAPLTAGLSLQYTLLVSSQHLDVCSLTGLL